MDNHEPKSRARLAASVVLLLVIGASLIGAYYLQTNSASTSTSTLTTTGPSGQLLLFKTWGPWIYDVSINSTSVRVGGALLVSGTLTYHGKVNITIDEVEPTNGLSVYNSTGGMVWEYTPGEITFEATITPGETLGSPICIPVTTTPPSPSAQNHNCDFPFRQPVPGVYSIEVGPQFYSSQGHQDLGSNLLVTANFTVY
jgi:hypothetical protein